MLTNVCDLHFLNSTLPLLVCVYLIVCVWVYVWVVCVQKACVHCTSLYADVIAQNMSRQPV